MKSRLPQSDQNNPQAQIRAAQVIVSDLGHALADKADASVGMPESQLPYSKDKIKNALQLLIWELGKEQSSVAQSLAEAYVLLAQFIPDEDAEILHRGQAALQSNDPEHKDWQFAGPAARIINDIKLEMENALEEIRIFLRHDKGAEDKV